MTRIRYDQVLLNRIRYLFARMRGCTGYVQRFEWNRTSIIAHDGDTCPVHEHDA